MVRGRTAVLADDPDPVKTEAAAVFKAAWEAVRAGPEYQRRLADTVPGSATRFPRACAVRWAKPKSGPLYSFWVQPFGATNVHRPRTANVGETRLIYAARRHVLAGETPPGAVRWR